MKYKIKNKVWLYPGHAGWHFFTVPPEMASDISSRFHGLKRGWGSLPVHVEVKNSIGERSKYNTSIFPDKKSGTYLLPIKKEVRKIVGIQAGDILEVVLEIDKK